MIILLLKLSASGPKKNPYSSIDDKRDQIVLDKAYPANVSYITNLKEVFLLERGAGGFPL